MNIAILPLLFVVLGLFLALPILIGVFVYRDAESRGMNAPLWTIIAIFSPALLGLIIYLIARGDQRMVECPSCNASINESYAVCPSCGTALKGRCQRCDFPLNPGWEHCPQCGEQVPEDAKTPRPVRRKETKLLPILIAVIVIPILMVMFLFFGLTTFNTSTSSVGQATGMHIEEYQNSPEVYDWLLSSKNSGDGIYVLSYQREPRKKDETLNINYLVLFNGVEEDADLSMYADISLFKKDTYRIEFNSNGEENEKSYVLFQSEITASKDLPLTIYIDGEKQAYHHKESITPLSLNMGF